MQSSPAVVLETVKATRDFLNAELAKHETWEELFRLINLLTLLYWIMIIWKRVKYKKRGYILPFHYCLITIHCKINIRTACCIHCYISCRKGIVHTQTLDKEGMDTKFKFSIAVLLEISRLVNKL